MKILCPTCGGKGSSSIWKLIEISPPKYELIYMPCETCGGIGWIEKPEK